MEYLIGVLKNLQPRPDWSSLEVYFEVFDQHSGIFSYWRWGGGHFTPHVVMYLLFLQVVKNETGHYGTELFTEVAERIIDTHNKSEPLYLYLAQQAVHSANIQDPLQAPQRLLDVCQIILLTSKF